MDTYGKRNSAILSADAVGYSRLVQEDAKSAFEEMAELTVLISRTVRRYGGRVVDAVGDNVLAEFARAVDAVAAAVEIQRQVDLPNVDDGSARNLRLRIGVDAGEVIVNKEKIAGTSVNLAARLEGLAEPGGIALSGDVFDSVASELPLRFDYAGTAYPKNMPPVGFYRAEIPAEGEAMPGAGQLAAWRIRAHVATPMVVYFALGLAIAGVLLMAFGSPSELLASAGFAILFTALLLRYGIQWVPQRHRSIATILVVATYTAITGVQADSAVRASGGSEWAKPPAWNRPPGAPAEALENHLRDVLAVASDPDRSAKQREQQIAKLFLGVAHPDVPRLLLGARYVRRVPEDQREKVYTESAEIFSLRYAYAMMQFVMKAQELELVGEKEEEKGDVSVGIAAVGGKFAALECDFRLRKVDERWTILDLKIEGFSLMSNERDNIRELVSENHTASGDAWTEVVLAPAMHKRLQQVSNGIGVGVFDFGSGFFVVLAVILAFALGVLVFGYLTFSSLFRAMRRAWSRA